MLAHIWYVNLDLQSSRHQMPRCCWISKISDNSYIMLTNRYSYIFESKLLGLEQKKNSILLAGGNTCIRLSLKGTSDACWWIHLSCLLSEKRRFDVVRHQLIWGTMASQLLVSPLLFGFIYFISRKTISSAKGSSTVLQGISCVLFVKLSGRIYIYTVLFNHIRDLFWHKYLK